MPQPLPRPNPHHLSTNAIVQSAYNRCLDLEARHEQVEKMVPLQVLVSARFLGYMLLEAPTDPGRQDFAWEIYRCSSDSDDAMQKLAQLYVEHLLRLFRRNKGRTLTPRSHPSAPSFDTQRQAFSGLLEATPSSHDKAKKRALYRDHYRCIISGKIDTASVNAGLVVPQPGELEGKTQASHIFDRSTNEGLGDPNKSAYAASAHAVLLRFGQLRSIEELNGAGVHRLQNVLTLETGLHEFFDSLEIWLEKIDADDPDRHRYKLAAIRPSIPEYGRQIELTTPDPVEYPLPDPRYLRLHAACARVAHLSGAGEYIEKALRDIEDIGVLANDGGSDALYHALVRQQDIVAY
ncbi:hypothetical protein CPB84DRAFT_1733076 [Gymnopilus junonius]|uniref:HNH nuclease domain-containing protein n=1 Tax=Gymnopilus junonius TaxID=109634 RepID=A0A9P5TKZ6_GYMJU|nr:hypothetical protein CPB84DRAFT_1733076 [Gymnopilus junonius]